ncbi:AAA family ATPase [Pseudomonas syringae]|nr:AAA family ATPase [Pseudomonas syringae]
MVEHQLILFGPPGTSKSHRARAEKAKSLGVDKARIVPVTFHPDYSYGEFVARLLPKTQDKQIEYHVQSGPFIRALALAYMYQLQAFNGHELMNVVLLLDEINRGNCAEIFGDVFQLLDRDDEGWSSYEISVSGLVLDALEHELELKLGYPKPFEELPDRLSQYLAQRLICLPPNLYMIGTMNTSDESTYFMDSAFKRRWHFEFCPEGFEQVLSSQSNALMLSVPGLSWRTFVMALNRFIRERCTAPRLDDKLVGPWFIKAKRSIDKQALVSVYPEDMAMLEACASKFGTYTVGVQQSKAFDKILKNLAEKLSMADKERLLKHAGYEENAKLKFTKIRSETGHANPYYCSGAQKKFASNEKGLIIEDYLKSLASFELQVISHYIDRADIVGKLFFYLWDNVFERDKSPLCNLLGLESLQLRTFGQFVEQADRFIQSLCPEPVDV